MGPFQTLSLESYSRNPFLPLPSRPASPAAESRLIGGGAGAAGGRAGQEALAQLSLSLPRDPPPPLPGPAASHSHTHPLAAAAPPSFRGRGQTDRPAASPRSDSAPFLPLYRF